MLGGGPPPPPLYPPLSQTHVMLGSQRVWPGKHFKTPLQGAQPMPIHCTPNGKCLNGICNQQ